MPNMLKPQARQHFQVALGHHRAGRFADAAAGYRRVISVAPRYAPAHQNLSIALRRLGRLSDALSAAEAAVALDPAAAGPLSALGQVLVDLGRPEMALASYQKAIAIAPSDAGLRQNLGEALRRIGRPGEALDAFEAAIALEPNSASLHVDRGAALHGLGRRAEAAEAFATAAELDPRFAPAHRNLTIALRALGRPAEALASIERALALLPGDASQHVQRGDLLMDLERSQEALEAYERALAIDGASAPAHNGRGGALGRLDRLDDALAACERAIAFAPDLADAHRNRGVVLRKLRRPEEAIGAYDRAAALQPDNLDTYFLRSFCHLLMQTFDAGWRDYERRWAAGDFLRTVGELATPALRTRVVADPALRDVVGRDVLLIGEQGVGDVIMFMSIVPDLLAVAGRVGLVCDARLHRLFRTSFPTLELLDLGAPDHDRFSVVIGVGSLGRLFRNRVEDFPGVPYLEPSGAATAKWAARLGPADGKRRIGLSWRGGIARTGRSARSLDLDELRPVLALPGCEFVSLQYGDVSQELVAANESLASPIRSFAAQEIEDFEDLAALVRNLDLVVSVQTSLVHLSGAIGAAGLVMLPGTPEWRYGVGVETMPWYRSIRLFRQVTDGDWAPVAEAVAREAAARLDLEV